MKKLLCLLCAILCVATMLSGCGNGEQEKSNFESAVSSFDESGNESAFLGDETSQEGESESDSEGSDSYNPKYPEDKALFLAMDRHDVEWDGNKGYFYNYKGDLLEATEFSNMGNYFENGLSPAPDPMTGKVGFVDKDGVFQIEPAYEDASYFFKDGLALVMKESENGDEKWGYIDSKGNEVVPCIYDEATSFFESGYAVALKREQTESYETLTTQYILDKNGKSVVEILPEENIRIKCLYEDYFLATSHGDIFSFDYSKNKIAEISIKNNDGYYIGETYEFVTIENDYIFIDTAICVEFEKLPDVDSLRPKYESVRYRKLVGKNFIEEVMPYKFTSKRVSTTESGIGYGVVEGDKTVIPFKYDSIYLYNDYFIASSRKGNSESIDIYDKNYNLTAENVPYGLSYRGNYGFNPEYGRRCTLPAGYIEVCTKDSVGMAYGIIDYTGKVIVEPVFDEQIYVYEYRGLGKFEI